MTEQNNSISTSQEELRQSIQENFTQNLEVGQYIKKLEYILNLILDNISAEDLARIIHNENNGGKSSENDLIAEAELNTDTSQETKKHISLFEKSKNLFKRPYNKESQKNQLNASIQVSEHVNPGMNIKQLNAYKEITTINLSHLKEIQESALKTYKKIKESREMPVGTDIMPQNLNYFISLLTETIELDCNMKNLDNVINSQIDIIKNLIKNILTNNLTGSNISNTEFSLIRQIEKIIHDAAKYIQKIEYYKNNSTDLQTTIRELQGIVMQKSREENMNKNILMISANKQLKYNDKIINKIKNTYNTSISNALSHEDTKYNAITPDQQDDILTELSRNQSEVSQKIGETNVVLDIIEAQIVGVSNDLVIEWNNKTDKLEEQLLILQKLEKGLIEFNNKINKNFVMHPLTQGRSQRRIVGQS